MLKENEFNKLFTRGTKLPKIDTIRDTLKIIDIKRLKEIKQHFVKKAFKNKVFEKGTIDGHTVVAIDGTKFFGSNKKSCTEYVKNNHHSFHSGAIMSTVGSGPKLVMSLKTLYKTIKARWDIENSIFNNLKTECGLEHCYVHGGNAVEAVISLIFIVSNIM
jgi:hypothetical protein